MIGAPAVLLLVLLTALRAHAWSLEGPMAAIGFLSERQDIESTAHWLDITSQLTTNQPLFLPNNDGGGPMLFLLVISTALAAVLSHLTLGLTNDVAIATNAVILASWLLVAAAPLALAPLAEWLVPTSKTTGNGPRRANPWAVVFGIALVAAASASISASGNLAMQFALIGLAFWVAWFVTQRPRTGITWGIWVCFLGVLLSWPALNPFAFSLLQVSSPLQVEPGLRHLPDLAWLIIASLISAVGAATVWTSHDQAVTQPRTWRRFGPLWLLWAYAVAVTLTAAVTGSTEIHVAGLNVTAVVAVTGLVTTFPIAIEWLDRLPADRTLLTKSAVAGSALVFAVTLGGIVPGAFAALVPQPVEGTGSGLPWQQMTEVHAGRAQAIAAAPIACLFVPNAATAPSALPDGNRAYSCTRLLVALHGLSGRADSLLDWMGSEVGGSGSLWDAWYPNLVNTRPAIANLPVVVLDDNANVSGITPFRALVQRFPAAAAN